MPQFDLYLGDGPEEHVQFDGPEGDQQPIDCLTPGSDHHKFVLGYLTSRIKASEDEMTKFYARWQVQERKTQAYLSLPDYERMLRDMNNNSKPPAPAIILIPYQYATISTTCTYGMKVFCGKRPFFPLGADSAEAADNVRYMEAMVQRQVDYNKGIMKIFQLLLDGEIYGVAAIRCIWTHKMGKRRKLRAPTEAERLQYANNPGDLPNMLKDVEETVVYQGTELSNIDPFMFFPDPNVPMNEVSEKGEYVFWREYLGKHILMKAQAQGMLKYVDTVESKQGTSQDSKWFNLSHRSALTGGSSHAGDQRAANAFKQNIYQVDQGSVEIIPRELGLGEGELPEKWIFTILNKTQIVQAEPLDLDHGRHPIEVSEPRSFGYGFGQPASGDYIGPIQDIMSWFLDSHIYNVRSSLNNQWLYDPSKIDEASLKYPQPGKNIKLKPLAYGTDVRTALTQFPVSDATRGHMADLQIFRGIGDMVSAISDPMRGVAPSGGRRTATETRRVDENGSSRLAVHHQLISQQCLVRLAEQIVLDIQQNQDEEAWIQVIGEQQFQKVGPSLLMGRFTYTVHDGTLPLDRIESFDAWKEILMGVAQSPLLQRTHSLPRIFENVCSLGGAMNISSYRLVSEGQMDDLVRQGNAVPLGPNGPPMPGQAPRPGPHP